MGQCVNKSKPQKNLNLLKLSDQLKNNDSDCIHLQLNIECKTYFKENEFRFQTQSKQSQIQKTLFLQICYYGQLQGLNQSQLIQYLQSLNKISSFKLNDELQVSNSIYRFQVMQKLLQSWINIQQMDLNFLCSRNQIIKIGDEEIDQLASILIKCQRLQSLNLNLTNNKIQDQGMSKLGFGLILCKQLQNLTLIVTGNKFGLEGLNSLAQAILQCENIQILKLCQDLSFSMIENAKNNQFTSCAHYKIVELKFDELYNQSQEKNDEMINSLDLSRLNMFLLKFSSLQELSIIFKRSFNYIFIDTVLKASIIGIFLQNCQNLQSLDIDFDYCQVSQDELSKTFQIFANIKYLKCLSLSLKNTQVSPLGLTSLAIFLRKCLFLQDLNLSFKEKNYSKQIQVRFKQSVLKIKKLIQYQVLFC
ncbi:hypothetical protein ABPG74_020093 [Tetrahymena malaccensis]